MGNFPQNEQEALAMLYVQSRDLTGCAAGEVYDLYREAYIAIKNQKAKTSNAPTTKVSPPPI